jgi:hypothetical protein
MIVSVLGHTTLAEAERYTEEADRAGLAEDAVIKLEGHNANKFPQTRSGVLGCSTARNKTCENRKSIQRKRVEGRVLNALRHHLMDPALFKEFCDELAREMNRLRMEGSALLATARADVKRIERELGTLLNLVLEGGAADTINAKMVQLEDRKAELAAAGRCRKPAAPVPSRNGDVLSRTGQRSPRGVTR